MKRIVWTFGLIAGGILSVLMSIQMSLHDEIGFDRGEIIGYTTMVLSFLMIFFGVRSYRDTVGGGSVSFGRALAVGMCIMLIASLCYVATWQLIWYPRMADFPDKYAAHVLAKAKASGATAEQIAEQTRQMDAFKTMYKNPLVIFGMTLLEPLPVGLLFAFASAAILRRKRSDAGEAGTLALDAP